jgi:hypothetical protein
MYLLPHQCQWPLPCFTQKFSVSSVPFLGLLELPKQGPTPFLPLCRTMENSILHLHTRSTFLFLWKCLLLEARAEWLPSEFWDLTPVPGTQDGYIKVAKLNPSYPLHFCCHSSHCRAMNFPLLPKRTTLLAITVPNHDGGRPMEVNACILTTHMVYL